MYQSFNLPLCREARAEYGGWEGLRDDCAALGLQGVEGIWGGADIPSDFPPDLLVGYHLTFYPDWLDIYREDWTALLWKFGSRDAVRRFYGGEGPEVLLRLYRADLERAAALGARYVVFHVTDVSIEEGYTYRWLHSNREVIDAAAELAGRLLAGREWPFAFLVENQWWPGFTFTEPEETARLLEAVRYPRTGILLDTGHLMNANPALATEAEGLRFIGEMLDRHGPLCRRIQGVHLHQSLSGAYVRAHTGFLPPLPADYGARYGVSYGHIQRIDRHEPWTHPAVAGLVARIAPQYLTHELAASGRAARRRAVQTQLETLRRGRPESCGGRVHPEARKF